jgi:hypothetical protein
MKSSCQVQLTALSVKAAGVTFKLWLTHRSVFTAPDIRRLTPRAAIPVAPSRVAVPDAPDADHPNDFQKKQLLV